MTTAVLDALAAILLLTGGVFALIGAWGLARLPNFMMRLHAPTKAATLGVGCALAACAAGFAADEGWSTLRNLLPLGFVFLTAPVSAHMLARAHLLQAHASEKTKPPR